MSLFNFKKPAKTEEIPAPMPGVISSATVASDNSLAETVLNAMHDGVIMTNSAGVVQFANPAAITMAGLGSSAVVTGLDYGVVLRLETKDGQTFSASEHPIAQAITTGQPLEDYNCLLIVGQSNKRLPVAISVLPSGNGGYVIAFRDITKELEASNEQADFISTASHEMRTPVASIEGYLSLAINPQTATIDARAKGYLEAAHAASQHLGKLFQNLLDVTKLDDGHIRPQLVPVEMVSLLGEMVKGYLPQAATANIRLVYSGDATAVPEAGKRLEQVLYSYIDVDFFKEIMNNIVDNALKYTPAGGAVAISVRGDNDRVIVAVQDTGKGIAPDDLAHIFQKFYRVDNSDTRTIGGTGLGLYLVKQRAEAMGGRVWAESTVGAGSIFYVSLPRISADEYEKRMIPFRNQQMAEQQSATPVAPASASAAAPAPTSAPAAPELVPQPAPAPVLPPAPAPPISAAPPVSPTNNNLNGETK